MQMIQNGIYEGTDSYIFVSYAHKDSEKIYPLLTGMKENGFRVWYDAGIEAGTEWPQYIAERVLRSKCVIAFVSAASIESKNCAREITYAISKNKPMLVIYLEELELPAGMEMQLGILQAMFYYRHKDNASFMKSLVEAELLKECKVENEVVNEIVAETNICEGMSLDVEGGSSWQKQEVCEVSIESETLREELNGTKIEVEPIQTEENVEKEVESGLIQVEDIVENEAELELLQNEEISLKKTLGVSTAEPDWTEIFDYHVSNDSAYICELKDLKKGQLFKRTISVVIPSLIDGKKVSLSNDVFRECKNIGGVEFLEGITEITGASFYGCKNLLSIKFPKSLTKIGDSSFSFCEKLANVEFPENLKLIDRHAFSFCKNITSVDFSNGLEKIGNYAFLGCTKITCIDFPKSLKTIGDEAFAHCFRLTNVEFPEGLEEIGKGAFKDCRLTRVRLPKSLKTIGDNAFDSMTIVERND